jgi:hypothetical protein
MNEKESTSDANGRRRLQSRLLSKFEEIAQTFLNMLTGERGNGKVFTSLQDYLDGSELVNGAYCRRRTVLLATHDMKEELEAPTALQSKTLAKLESLQIRPVPQVRLYRDIATALLRMEVVIRLEAMQALVETTLGFNHSAPGAAGRLSPPARGQSSSRSYSPQRPTNLGRPEDNAH